MYSMAYNEELLLVNVASIRTFIKCSGKKHALLGGRIVFMREETKSVLYIGHSKPSD